MLDDIQFRINIADLTVNMKTRYEDNRLFCKDFLSDSEKIDIYASVSEEEIDREVEEYDVNLSRRYCECVCLYRAIAERLPDFDRFVFHGASVRVGDKGYIFTAPSGTGKSTHVGLLMKYFGDEITVINGDKPILGVLQDCVTVYSCPWAGKENWKNNISAPLAGIILLRRGKTNRITEISPAEYFDELMKQVYLPKNGEMMLKTLDLLDALAEMVPFYLLECDMSKEAAETSYGIMK
jgi:hypothetical protein